MSYVNAGTMDNDGWELEFSTNNMVKRGDWTLDLSLNFSNYVNTIIELDENVLNNYNPDFNYTNGGYLTRLQINNSFGSIYGFRYKGVYQYDKSFLKCMRSEKVRIHIQLQYKSGVP